MAGDIRRIAQGLAACALAACAHAAEPTALPWQLLPSGLEHCAVTAQVGEWPVSVELVRVPATGFGFRVVARQDELVRAADVASDARAVLAVTASSQPATMPGCPYGWLVADGVELSSIEYQTGGVFRVSSDGLWQLHRTRLITRLPEVRHVAQIADWLVIEGTPYPDLRPGLDTFGFLATDAERRLVLGRTTSLAHPAELATFLARPEARGGAGLVEVLSPARGRDVQWFLRGGAGSGGDELAPDASPVPSLLVVER